uniref:Uncharacterized protein n=1 Tax=Cannabis sativa TaxID=3483 RepID=A0A803NRM2_CANSA
MVGRGCPRKNNLQGQLPENIKEVAEVLSLRASLRHIQQESIRSDFVSFLEATKRNETLIKSGSSPPILGQKSSFIKNLSGKSDEMLDTNYVSGNKVKIDIEDMEDEINFLNSALFAQNCWCVIGLTFGPMVDGSFGEWGKKNVMEVFVSLARVTLDQWRKAHNKNLFPSMDTWCPADGSELWTTLDVDNFKVNNEVSIFEEEGKFGLGGGWYFEINGGCCAS